MEYLRRGYAKIHIVMHIDISRIGGDILKSLDHTKGAFALFTAASKNLHALKNPLTRMVFYRQVYFTGVEALSKIAIIAALIGIVIITQVTSLVGANALLTGKILVWTVGRELGPLLVAIIIIARSSTAVASELGAMKVNREVDYLMGMGIDPMQYLIVPRIVGLTACVFILTFYFQIIAIFGGLALSSLLIDLPFLQQLRGIMATLGLHEIIVSLVKSFLFGLVVSTVSCYHGLRVRSSITEIPQATTVAVMQSLFLVFILNGIITVLSFI